MPTAELYNNLALCCFYAQQYDMALTCFDRALALAEDQLLADVWYNLGLVALSSGDKTLATRAFRLALVYDNCHAESYNNLGVLELTSGNVDQVTNVRRYHSQPRFPTPLVLVACRLPHISLRLAKWHRNCARPNTTARSYFNG
ncbi:hypothetical protein HPB50_015885 [Hyalomma asiaticum]|uniref:Uncharacterized protein n=1 Tax=Hyalomma asiaticum TaxID=266040 RepID=A0ACB7RV10_HYAAI|nr:hypothetical protein HPB50_015885 [Hyalomma asiaticum]